MSVSRKHPWNIANYQVYALSTIDKAPNAYISICSMVTKVSIQPRIFVISILKGSKALENLRKNPQSILQLSSFEDLDFVRYIGLKSGKSSFELRNFENRFDYDALGVPYLKTSISAVWLETFKFDEFGGDHILAFFRVKTFKTMNPTKKLLTYEDLRLRSIKRT